MKTIIAIDGPAGSGKSTIARLLADKLQLPYLDTGAMYRALTFLAVEQGIDMQEKMQLARLAKVMRLSFKIDKKGMNQVFINGQTVTSQIRTPELTNLVSHIADVPEIRKQMAALQRRMAKATGAVVEGRDIGSVVFPKTPFKFFLTGDFQVRVERRFRELSSKGTKMTMEDLARTMKQRDAEDVARKIGGLKRAKGAHLIDTTSLTIPQVVDKISELISRQKPSKDKG